MLAAAQGGDGQAASQVTVPERGRARVQLTQADRIALYELSEKLGQGAFKILDKPGSTELEAGPFVGLFALPSSTLRVTPKTDVHPWNVLYMLLRSTGRQWTLPPVGQDIDFSDLQEALAALFLQHLQEQVWRGLLRRSERVQEDSPTVRGRLRVPDYLRRANPTRLPVEYPDRTANHPVNRLFLLVLERLAHRIKAPRSRQQLAELRVLLHDAGVSALPAVPADQHRYTLNRLERRYQPALDIAWLLLQGQGVVPDIGKWHGPAFTFNMDRVYEKFLERVLIEDVLPGSAYSASAQGKGLSERFLFSEGTLELKPDLLIRQGDRDALIIDFKNKRSDGQLGRDDLYQMYAYARHLSCAEVLLLYPGQQATSHITASRGEPLTVTAASLDLSQSWQADLSPLHHQLRTHLRERGLHL